MRDFVKRHIKSGLCLLTLGIFCLLGCDERASTKFDAEEITAFVSTFQVDGESRFFYELLECRRGKGQTSVYSKPDMWFSQPSLGPDGVTIAFYVFPIPVVNEESELKGDSLSILLLDTQTKVTTSLLQTPVQGRHVLPLLEPAGEWAPQWSADGRTIYASVPFGQRSSGIKYSIWKINVDTKLAEELPIPDATHPIVSTDGQWLFFCQVPTKDSTGAIRDIWCHVYKLAEGRRWESKLPSQIIHAPVRAVFSRNSKVLGVLCDCNIGTSDWPVVEPCVEFFEIRDGRWGLLNRIRLGNVRKLLRECSYSGQNSKLKLFPSYFGTYGFRLTPDGSRFLMLAYEKEGATAGSGRFFVCEFQISSVCKSMRILHRIEQQAVPLDVILTEQHMSIILQKREGEVTQTFLRTFPIMK